MEVLILYVWFAATTGLYSVVFHLWPLMQEAREKNPGSTFVKHPLATYLVYFVIATLWAPKIIFAEIVASGAFVRGLRKVLLEQEAKVTAESAKQ
jgi:hypothetical protein